MPRHRVDQAARGFVLKVEEEWVDDNGAHWYCREMLRTDVAADGIRELSVLLHGAIGTRLV